MRVSAIVTVVLGGLAAISLVLSHLALTDIAHGTEPDLSLEWNVVRAGFFIVTLFIVSVLVNLFIQHREGNSFNIKIRERQGSCRGSHMK